MTMAANEKRNTELMEALDDAWNLRDWDTFEKRHKRDTVVRWPAKPLTHGFAAYLTECIQFFTTFPDNRVENRPYKTSFANGDWTCSIAQFTGTMQGPLVLADGARVKPTGRRFDLDLRRVTRWHDGRIVEEYLFYDLAAMMRQLGIEA